MGLTIKEVIPTPLALNMVQELPIRNLVLAMLLSGNFKEFHRVLDNLFKQGKLSKKEYEEISTLTAKLILEEKNIDLALEIANKLETAILNSQYQNLPKTKIVQLLLSENFAEFHRLLDNLLREDRISKKEYEEISTLTAELILENDGDKKSCLSKK